MTLTHTAPPRRLAAVLCLLLLVARGTAADPIRAEARLRQPPVAGGEAVIEFRFVLEPGVHVYAEESHFFQFQENDSRGLGGQATVERPPTRQIPDLLAAEPGALARVFAGEASVLVRRPVTAASGQAWAWSGSLQYQGCTETTCFPPAEVRFAFAGTIDGPPAVAPAVATGKPLWGGRSLLWGTLAAFLAGMALSFTPCVYPMIGITVAVIGGRGAGRRRTLWLTFLYVLGLSLVYALAGVAVALLGSRAAAFLRSAWVLWPIGALFLLMGLSMFDLFTLQTPGSLAARLQSIGGQGRAAGAFLMGALSAFVVGPCVTAPLLSLVTFVATSGRVVVGFLYFFALAWGMGLLLFVAGSASSLLPRAGAWMTRVKHVLGVVLVWGAFYFTRPLVGETVFLVATLVCFAAGTAFAGLLQVPEHGRGNLARGALRLAAGLLILALGATHWVSTLRDTGPRDARAAAAAGTIDLAAELAKGKPVLLDFTAPWCAICKEIERDVIARPEIQARLRDFTFVRVDFDSNPELVRRFALLGPPAFVFLDATGRPEGPAIVTGEALRDRLLP